MQQLNIAVTMSSVIGRKRNVSGRTTPKDCLNIAPSRIAKPAIKLLPNSQFPNVGFSSASRKYGRTATVKSVRNRKRLSKLKEKTVRPNSTAKKKSTNDVSKPKLFPPVISFWIISMRDCVFIIFQLEAIKYPFASQCRVVYPNNLNKSWNAEDLKISKIRPKFYSNLPYFFFGLLNCV